MTDFKLTDVTENHPLIEKLKAALEKSAGQKIALVNVLKPKRTDGATVLPLELVFGGNQVATFLLRQGGDVYKVLLNGKAFLLHGDVSIASAEQAESTGPGKGRKAGDTAVESRGFAAAIADIGMAVAKGQKAFQALQERKRVAVPTTRNTPKNAAQQLAELQTQDAELQTALDQKNSQIEVLQKQLDQLEGR